jgi:hypothetical protein
MRTLVMSTHDCGEHGPYIYVWSLRPDLCLLMVILIEAQSVHC